MGRSGVTNLFNLFIGARGNQCVLSDGAGETCTGTGFVSLLHVPLSTRVSGTYTCIDKFDSHASLVGARIAPSISSMSHRTSRGDLEKGSNTGVYLSL